MAAGKPHRYPLFRKAMRLLRNVRHYLFTYSQLKRSLRNAWLDLRYGGSFLGGWAATRFAHLGAHDTGNTDYSILPRLFANRVKESDVLVDVGCGRGRVIVWWLSQGYRNKLIGLELDPQIATDCAHRLRKHQSVRIITGNALDKIQEEGTLFYLFDPFAPHVVRKFKEKLEGMFCVRDDIRVVFHMTQSLEAFESDRNWRVEDVPVPVPPPFRSAVLTLIKQELYDRCKRSLHARKPLWAALHRASPQSRTSTQPDPSV